MARQTRKPAPPEPEEDDEEIDLEGDEPEVVGADVRLDKWLWAARMYKSRSMASDACENGRVRVNEITARPARTVRIGDTIEASAPGGKKIWVVKALSNRRGPAAVAQTLYEDHSPPPPPREPVMARWDRGEGRPTKRDRRRMDKMRGW